MLRIKSLYIVAITSTQIKIYTSTSNPNLIREERSNKKRKEKFTKFDNRLEIFVVTRLNM